MTGQTLPSQKAADRQKTQEEIKQAQIEDANRMRGAFRRIFTGTGDQADATAVLQYIHDQCGYGGSKLAVNPGTAEINIQSSLYQAARETVYINIRKFLTVEILKEVEYNEDQI